MSVFCLALFDCNILTSFRIFTFATNNKLKLDLEVVFFDCNNTRMGSIVHNSFNDWITDIFRCSLSLIKLCNAKTGYDIKKNSFETLAVSLLLILILSHSTIVIFSFEMVCLIITA